MFKKKKSEKLFQLEIRTSKLINFGMKFSIWASHRRRERKNEFSFTLT